MKRHILASALLITAAATAFSADPVPTAADIKKAFLENDIPTLEKGLPALKDAAVPAAEKADITYIRKVLTENRPQWFYTAKTNRTFNINTQIWSRTHSIAFDPSMGKTSFRTGYTNGKFAGGIYWTQDDIDSTKEAEHGFSKGELMDLNIWSNLGILDGYSLLTANDYIAINNETQKNESAKKIFEGFLWFRCHVTGAYYSLPRARRWCIWLDCRNYMAGVKEEMGAPGRQAVALVFIMDILTRPDKYPSIKIPKDIGPDEESVALFLKDHIEKNGWTIAEDQLIRDALKAAATANEFTSLKAASIALPNKLFMSLDPAQDKPNREKRDAWIKAAIGKLK